VYWKLIKSHSVTIERNREWFDKHLPVLEKMWKMVEYYRKNENHAKILFDYIDTMPSSDFGEGYEASKKKQEQEEKNNKKIMKVAEFIFNEPQDNDKKKLKEYSSKLRDIISEIDEYHND